MHPDRIKQREWAIEMYGDPKEQKGWFAKFNSWFAIYEEMKREPANTRTSYILYQVEQKKIHKKDILALPGVIVEERTLEKLAG